MFNDAVQVGKSFVSRSFRTEPNERPSGFDDHSDVSLVTLFAPATDPGLEITLAPGVWEIADEIHITNVAVHPRRRRQGIARALLGGVLSEARARDLRLIVLEVRPSNREAIGLYESSGYTPVMGFGHYCGAEQARHYGKPL